MEAEPNPGPSSSFSPSLRAAATVAVFAKWPEPGRVKTRLCPPLTHETAAELQRACLGDLWDRLGLLTGVHLVLCYDPPGSADQFKTLLGEDIFLMEQPAGDLGQRLIGAFATLCLAGLGPVAVVGADSPDLPLATIHHALAVLKNGRCDVALAPAEDGGYTLVSLTSPHPELFHDIPWSTPSVFVETLAACRTAGLRVHTLEPWYDVDDAASLERLRGSVRQTPGELPRLHRWFAGEENEYCVR
jgi:rSAM/selenodomain-associated transferase 1